MENKKELLEQLKFHWEENMKIDELLTSQCKKEIQHLIYEEKYLEAKEYTRKFFEGYNDYCLGSMMIFANINRLMNKSEN